MQEANDSEGDELFDDDEAHHEQTTVLRDEPVITSNVPFQRRFQKLRKVHEPWTPAEVAALEQGLMEFKGSNHWQDIIDCSGGVLANRTNVQCKDKARTELKKLERRGITARNELGAWGYVKYPEM